MCYKTGPLRHEKKRENSKISTMAYKVDIEEEQWMTDKSIMVDCLYAALRGDCIDVSGVVVVVEDRNLV